MSKLLIAGIIALAAAATMLAVPRIGDGTMEPHVTPVPGWTVSTCHC